MIGVLRSFGTAQQSATRAFQAVIALMIGMMLVAAVPAQANPRYAALVIDANTGETLFSRYADERRYPASITKVMTLYIVFEELEAGRLQLDTPLKVSQNAANQAPSKVGVQPGQTITVKDAIGVLATKSANDVAVVVAENISGSVSAFAGRMTRTARAIGMSHTTFRNPHGLPDSDQVTTARDIATMAIAVMERFPQYYKYFGMKSYTYSDRTYRNHNRLLARMSGIDGLKTGYIGASGFNLVASLRRDGKHMIGVVMGGRTASTRDAHMIEILTAALPEASRGGAKILMVKNAPLPQARPVVVASAAPQILVPSSTVPATIINASAGKPYPLPEHTLGALPVDDPIAQQIEVGSADDSAPPASSAAPVGDWVIQVGAFENEKLAQDTLARARLTASDLLSGTTAFTETTEKNGNTLWRARFAGFGRAMAETACAELKRQSFGCFPTRN